MSRPAYNAGWFRKGHDARRHTLTVDDCRRGFHAALIVCSKNKKFRRWLMEKVETTSRPATVAAFRARQQRRAELATSSFD